MGKRKKESSLLINSLTDSVSTCLKPLSDSPSPLVSVPPSCPLDLLSLTGGLSACPGRNMWVSFFFRRR